MKKGTTKLNEHYTEFDKIEAVRSAYTDFINAVNKNIPDYQKMIESWEYMCTYGFPSHKAANEVEDIMKDVNPYEQVKQKQTIKLTESQLRNLIKESIKKVLKENYQIDDWKMGDWRTFPMPEPDDKFSVVLLNRYNNIVRETAKYFKNVKDAYDYYKMITRQTPKQDAVMFRKPQHTGEPWIRVRTSNKI